MIGAYRRAAGSLNRASDALLLLIRVAIGLLFLDHGLMKYQAQGGLTGFEFFLRSLKNAPAPALTAHVVPALEVVGGILLLAGLLTRIIALLLALEMVFTGSIVKLADLHTGIVSASGAGAELDIVYLLALVVVLILGPGRASLDRVLKLEGRPASALPAAPVPTTAAAAVR